MKLVFDDQALEDIQRIFARIARDNQSAAEGLIGRIFDRVERLGVPELTDMGRPGAEPGTRELIEYPYIIIYEVREDLGMIVVLAVMHGARDRS